MEINFDQLLAEANKPTEKETLLAIVAGIRGGGKSTLLGTTGLPTLLIYFQRERHAAAAAKSLGGQVVAIAVDVDDKGNLLPADTVIRNVFDLLRNPSISKKFGVVGFDGISVFDYYVQKHKTVEKAQKYKESEAIEELYAQLISAFTNLQDQGIHVIATIATEGDADKATGEYTNITPVLRGYNSTSKVMGSFPDVFCVGKVQVTNEEGVTTPVRMIQFGASFNKSGKKMSGETRSLSFDCRLTGVPQQLLPEDGVLPASLKKLIEFKKEAINKAREKFQKRDTK